MTGKPPIQPIERQHGQPRAGKKTLASIVGAAAAAILLVAIPREESGRTVTARVAADGSATVTHVAGRQYLRAYLDAVGIPTACDGITKGVRMGQTYSEAECGALLEHELAEHAEGVMRCTPALARHGRDNQRAAAVLLAYNIGVSGWCRSTAARRFSAAQWRQGCDAFLMWDKAGGRVLRGLSLRRQRERALCLKGLG
jgi:lysozyme